MNTETDIFGNKYSYPSYSYPHQKRKVKISAGMNVINQNIKPPTYQYSYSNEDSQGALICGELPDFYNPKTQSYSSAYSDRIAGWDYDRFKKACEIAGGDQVWAYRLPSLSFKKLQEFAKIALNLPVLPEYVRVIHYYNIATGYSCPVVEAVYNIE